MKRVQFVGLSVHLCLAINLAGSIRGHLALANSCSVSLLTEKEQKRAALEPVIQEYTQMKFNLDQMINPDWIAINGVVPLAERTHLKAILEQKRIELGALGVDEGWIASSMERLLKDKGNFEKKLNDLDVDRKKLRGDSIRQMLSESMEGGLYEEALVLRGHAGPIHIAKFRIGSAEVVTAADEGSVRVWDGEVGGDGLILPGHRSLAERIAVSIGPDGKKMIVTIGKNGTVWDLVTKKVLAPLDPLHKKEIYGTEFSRDGRFAVSASDDGTARVWDIETGHAVASLVGHQSRVRFAKFSPDGKKVVTASWDHTARIWDLSKLGGPTFVPPSIALSGHKLNVEYADFSPDGLKVVTASGDKTAKVWDAVSGVFEFSTPECVNTVTLAKFSPDGKVFVILSSDGLGEIWDAKTGNFLNQLKKNHHAITDFNFSPDGKKIVTVGANIAVVWQTAAGKVLSELAGHENQVMTAEFSADGFKIVTGSFDQTARVWAPEGYASLGMEDRLAMDQWFNQQFKAKKKKDTKKKR